MRQRQSVILDIVQSKSIYTLDELVAELTRFGYFATQATVSRDIKELGLVKILDSSNRYKYATVSSESNVPPKFVNVFKEAVLNVSTVDNIVVLKTIDGSANMALTVLNQLRFSEAVANVAGFDAIICVTKNTVDANALKEKITAIIQ